MLRIFSSQFGGNEFALFVLIASQRPMPHDIASLIIKKFSPGGCGIFKRRLLNQNC
jgi:hypothetical protein